MYVKRKPGTAPGKSLAQQQHHVAAWKISTEMMDQTIRAVRRNFVPVAPVTPKHHIYLAGLQ